MRLLSFITLLAASFLTACEEPRMTCAEHHEVLTLVGYHDTMVTTSKGRKVVVSEPIVVTKSICSKWIEKEY